VSPAGNSDNVLLSINPTVSFEYEYNISAGHPAGTFWYHPHLHGSTALQVSSGMAGVLIIRGSRTPAPQSNGDIDTLLRNADGSPYRERLILLQQIQYSCRDSNNNIKRNPDGTYLCDTNDVGGLESYSDRQFGPETWKTSGRYTSINGEVLPTFVGAQAGRIERWRVVHAGVRDTVNLRFRKMRAQAAPLVPVAPAAAAQDNWIAQNCPGIDVSLFSIAHDGLTRAQIATKLISYLQPGYREDLLVVFPEEGDYCVIDEGAQAQSAVNNEVKSRRYLGKVSVAAGQTVRDAGTFVETQLIAAANQFMPLSTRQKVRDDLANGLKLSSFVPHRDIENNEVIGQQSVAFRIDTGFKINGNSYDPARIDRVLPLGSVEEWTLRTENAFGHPFHIHVNPFQIMKIVNENTGQDVSEAGDTGEPQYANLKNVWKDTLFIRQGYVATVRTLYQRYIGDFVLHCHILDHEDQGMMQNIRIGLPDGTGGVASPHH
jgi:FtsP/CotA-like multicopper oxidase with cupredoxin domain